MDWKQFIANIVSSLAWPTITAAFMLIFRSEVKKIIQRLAHLKYKEFEVDFAKIDEQVQQIHRTTPEAKQAPQSPAVRSLEDQVFNTAEQAPVAAILLAWSSLETAITAAVDRLETSPESASYRSPIHNIEMLTQHGLPLDYSNLVKEMRTIRNRVVHEHGMMLSITQEQALHFSRAAIDVINYLETLGKKT